ncbi:hypothetical protein BIV57_13755 [Mangrovactinospora gilvigrisea]|uniref:TIGR00374 family protein n=1 Tax=Mangrovactinospora gilvigrisea TaxID=1428644 RepID=A0A1J7CBA7_9ACTN|nr:hypothetical protein BIV57_13755 [Mangrovactinospora gilvigrisea]
MQPRTPGGATGVPLGPSDVSVDEPLLPARVHRPADLIRFVIGLLALALAFFLTSFATATTAGLQSDVQQSEVLRGLTSQSHITTAVIGFASGVALLVVPIAFAVERLVKRDGLRVADGVLAAVLAHGAALAVNLWVRDAAPSSVVSALTYPTAGGGATAAVHGYLAPVLAFMSAVGLSRRPRWRIVLWVVIVLDAATALISFENTAMSLVVTVLLGWAMAFGTLYAVGAPNVRPTGTMLLAGLRRLGFRPTAAYRAPDAPDDTRRYLVACAPDGAEDADDAEDADGGERGEAGQGVAVPDDHALLVNVIDREQQASSFFYRLWRRIQLRVLLPRRSLLSLRQTLEHEALVSYAATAAGVRVPELIATAELGPDAVMLVYRRLDALPLTQVPDEELTDDLLRGIWREVRGLAERRIAHRGLVAESILLTPDGRPWLTNLRNGEIAAGDLVLRMDIAELLCTLALRVGAERSVAAAAAVMGADTVAAAIPVLQPVALSRETRTELKQLNKLFAAERRERAERIAREAKERREKEKEQLRKLRRTASAETTAEAENRIDEEVEAELEAEQEPRDLLSQIRHQVLLLKPAATVEPVRLARIKARTMISFVALAVAAYLLLPSLARIDLTTVFTDADWKWALFAAFCAFMTYIGATMNMVGYVPERVPRIPAFMVQVAASFVKVVLPALVGGAALNTRYLQKNGVRPGLAVASVGASQMSGSVIHMIMLLVLGVVSGTQSSDLPSTGTILIAVAAVLLIALMLVAIPPLRRWMLSRVRPMFVGVLPRMLDIVQRPQKLLTGVGGTMVLTAGFVGCLYTSVYAFGGHIDFVACAVVYLAGNAVGSAVPTPGGIGTVETALIAALVTIGGVPRDVATAAVLLYRLMTFWLPILPGWFCFNWLQRKQML